MYLCHSKAALAAMETDRLTPDFVELGNICAGCGAELDGDDCYEYEEAILCAECIKDALFEEYGDDYRIR